MKNKKLKLGGFSILVTVLFLAGLVLINVLAGQMTDRFFLKLDLTEQGLYTLSEETTNVLKSINTDIKITVLDEEATWENDIRSRLVETLRNYAAMSGGFIELNYINPALNPQLKSQYPLLTELTEGDIIIECGKRYTSVTSNDLFDWALDANYNYAPSNLNAEQILTSSLLYVMSDQTSRAVFLEGHGEGATAGLQALFEKANYECETINLNFTELPEDAVIVISAAPKSDFQTVEIERLDAYMRAGGNTIILYDLDTPKLDNVELYLAEWGISIESKLVLDAQYNFGMLYSVAALTGEAEDALPSLSSAGSSDYLVMNVSRPVVPLWAAGERGYRKLSPIILSYPSSYAKTFSEDAPIENAEKESGDETGPFFLGLLSHDSTPSAASNMLVSNYGLVADSALSDSSYVFNSRMIGLIANDLNTSGQSVIVPAKTLAGSTMTVMAGQARMILILMVILLPLLIMGTGILVWVKRKRL